MVSLLLAPDEGRSIGNSLKAGVVLLANPQVMLPPWYADQGTGGLRTFKLKEKQSHSSNEALHPGENSGQGYSTRHLCLPANLPHLFYSACETLTAGCVLRRVRWTRQDCLLEDLRAAVQRAAQGQCCCQRVFVERVSSLPAAPRGDGRLCG